MKACRVTQARWISPVYTEAPKVKMHRLSALSIACEFLFFWKDVEGLFVI